MNRHRPCRERAGFSLIELLVVVSIIAILVAIALPVLVGSRRTATQTVYLAINRQLVTATRLYANNNDDRLPYMATPGDLHGPIVARGYTLEVSYFAGQSTMWASIVVPEYYEPRDAHIEVEYGLYPPGEHYGWPGAPEEIFRTQFRLTSTAFARPEYFRTVEPPDDYVMLQPTRWSDVAFPSNKGIIVEYEMRSSAHPAGYQTTKEKQAIVGMGDGSASVRSFYVPGWEANTVTRPLLNPIPTMATRNGLAGRDY